MIWRERPGLVTRFNSVSSHATLSAWCGEAPTQTGRLVAFWFEPLEQLLLGIWIFCPWPSKAPDCLGPLWRPHGPGTSEDMARAKPKFDEAAVPT